MWSDKDTSIDLIDYDHLIKAVNRILENNDLIPSTIGIFGDWGSGKSSLMRMIEEGYKKNEGVLTVKFNGWLFEGYEDAKSVLMGTILEEIISNRTLTEKAKKIVVKLFKKVDWLKLAKHGLKYGISFATLGPAGLGISALSDLPKVIADFDYEKFLHSSENKEKSKTLRMSIREFHSDFHELLLETKITKLIVFIDDLDRCMPDTVIDTLEAIKLFLYTENTAFVISADEQLIEYAVSKRFPNMEGIRESISSDYLEKLIQYPLRIPQLGNLEIETYINLLLTSLHIRAEFENIRIEVLRKKNESVFGSVYTFENCEEFLKSESITDELKEDLILSSQITPILTEGLNGNPRQCKRFLNMFLMRMEMSKDKNLNIEKRILSKLMLLEYFRTETFKSIFKLQLMQKGKPAEISFVEKEIQKTIDDKGMEKKSQKKLETNANLDLWLKDDWLVKWFTMKPELSNVDLRPYFYLSRDKITSISSESSRMNPKVEEILSKLSSKSELKRKQGIDKVETINEIDATSILNMLIKKLFNTEDEESREVLLKTINQFCAVRKELISELLAFYNKVPEKFLNQSVIPQLQQVVKGTNYVDNLNELLKKWSENKENKILANISQKTLEKV